MSKPLRKSLVLPVVPFRVSVRWFVARKLSAAAEDGLLAVGRRLCSFSVDSEGRARENKRRWDEEGSRSSLTLSSVYKSDAAAYNPVNKPKNKIVMEWTDASMLQHLM